MNHKLREFLLWRKNFFSLFWGEPVCKEQWPEMLLSVSILLLSGIRELFPSILGSCFGYIRGKGPERQ